MPNNYFPELKSKAVFPSDEPKPQFKALVVGLEAGGQIPIYAGEAAIYHFLEGEGLMTPLRMKPLMRPVTGVSVCMKKSAAAFLPSATITSLRSHSLRF